MGCNGDKSVEVNGDKPKQYHDMSEEEQAKIKKQLEEQDKNLEPEKQENEVTKCDFDALAKKLPIKKTKEDRKERLELWKKINEYGNGYCTFKRLNIQLEKYLQLPAVIKNKGPMKLAFNAASDKYERYGIRKEDNLIEWMEFRIFLVYLRQYFEYWVMFEKLDKSGDNKISLSEFKKAIPQMKNWGVEIKEEDAEQEFKSIDTNGSGSISFEEFCNYAINKSLDLEEDDSFDDEELKNLK